MCVCVCVSRSVMSNSVIPWTVAHQASFSMGFSRQEYWVGCRSLLQGIFPTQGSNLHLLIAGTFFPVWATREVPFKSVLLQISLLLNFNFKSIWKISGKNVSRNIILYVVISSYMYVCANAMWCQLLQLLNSLYFINLMHPRNQLKY